MAKNNVSAKTVKVVNNHPVPANINIENAKIVFRNFEGKAGTYNAAGQRNFSVLLDPDQARILKEIGWNVKWMKPRDPEDQPQAHLPVKVSYDKYPPMILLITSRKQKVLDEESINILDWAEIKSIDLIVKPSVWEVNGNHGVKAYVKNMYVTIVEDTFAAKYENPPDSAQKALLDEGD